MVSTQGEQKVHFNPGPQTIFKLSTLSQYLPRMIAMILSNPGESLTLVDGFAGNGKAGIHPGSTRIMLEAAERWTQSKNGDPQRIQIIAVEKDRARYNDLLNLKNEFPNIIFTALNDTIENHLQRIVESIKKGLFVFLDPYGLQIPFNVITSAFSSRFSNNAHPTELLLNVSSQGLLRTAGSLEQLRNKSSKLSKMLGPSNWKDICDSNLSGDLLAKKLTECYINSLQSHTGFRDSLIYPVKRTNNIFVETAVYRLALLSARPQYSFLPFYDSLTRARPDWIKEIDEAEAQERRQAPLVPLDEVEPLSIDFLKAQVRNNICALMNEHKTFCLKDYKTYFKVLGACGFGRIGFKEINQILKSMEQDNVIFCEKKTSTERYKWIWSCTGNN